MHYWFIVTVIVAFVRPYKKFVHNLTETLILVLITYAMWSAPLFQSTARFIPALWRDISSANISRQML